jgi:hypothetical protein
VPPDYLIPVNADIPKVEIIMVLEADERLNALGINIKLWRGLVMTGFGEFMLWLAPRASNRREIGQDA